MPRDYAAFGRRLNAQNAFFREACDLHPKGYLLDGVDEPADIADVESVLRDDRPVIITPQDAHWLEPDQCFVPSDVDFEQLAGGAAWRRYSSSPELIEALRSSSMQYGADVKVTVHSRIVQPALDVVLLLLCIPIILVRHDRNLFVAAGICLLLVGGYLLIVFTCHAMGDNSYLFSPALAAWFPLLLFLPIMYCNIQVSWQ